MSSFEITGGTPLRGHVTSSGNKNAVLPMLAAAMLTDEQVTLTNVPAIRDVFGMLELLRHLGVDVEHEGNMVRLQAREITCDVLPRELCGRLRTSFLCVAPLLVRRGYAKVFPPGGDVIGRRRLDSHVYGLRKLGTTIDEGEFEFAAPARLTGAEMFLTEASVTGTEHLMMAAALAKGTTIIRNAASEPHVQDLGALLEAMGCPIQGLGTDTLVIEGQESLHGAHHCVAPDHIEIGSFLALAAATGGDITVGPAINSHFWMTYRVFERFQLKLEYENESIHLPGGQTPHIKHDLQGHIPQIDDGPWPQFPSDLMSCMLVLATQSKGTVLFFEKMFESRLYFVDPLIQMGASIIVCDPHRVVVSGKTKLRAQPLRSPDIRAGIALLGAALCADGTSTIENVEIIDRGYENIEGKLSQLGAQITRLP